MVQYSYSAQLRDKMWAAEWAAINSILIQTRAQKRVFARIIFIFSLSRRPVHAALPLFFSTRPTEPRLGLSGPGPDITSTGNAVFIIIILQQPEASVGIQSPSAPFTTYFRNILEHYLCI